MATVLDEQKPTSKSEVYLRHKFAELCARIKRADLLTHLLALALATLTYALSAALFDWSVGNATAVWIDATRWAGFVVFVGIFGFLLLRTVQCWLRPVNPYYVAHQLEQSMPDAKNSLINWLDLHDEGIPLAFQKNLSARAAERLEETNTDQTVKTRKNWVLLGVTGVPVVGLVILLVLMGPVFLASMLRAFVPFYTPAPILQTRITVMEPAGGDVEVGQTQSIRFAVKIDGRVPGVDRPGAPTMSYRYQVSEDYLTKPLQPEGAGIWATELGPTQLRTGFTYKISAGDAETQEYRVQVRSRAHVKQYEVTYNYRPYRRLPKTTIAFPNDRETRPTIRGPRGSEVELVIRASRPVKKATIEIATGGVSKIEPMTKLANDAFTCKWTLDQPGQFRVAFTASDREENSDRDWHPIDVPTDDAPTVVLTSPGKDVKLPCNGTLELEGEAISNVGIKGLTLHFRAVGDPVTLLPQVYRPEMSFRFDDGSYPGKVEYTDFIPLDELRNEQNGKHLFDAGVVIEYWLEATDCTDVPNPNGIVGKSPVYKVTLTKPLDDKTQKAKRDAAGQRRSDHAKKQDGERSKQNKQGKSNQGGGSGSPNPQQAADQLVKDKKDAEEKIKQAMDEKDKQKDKGGAKSGEQDNAGAKGNPENSPDTPQPKGKDSPSMSPGDSGNAKDKGSDKGSAGNPKDDGDKDGKSEPSTKADAKGIEKNGPDPTNKDANAKGEPQPPQAAGKAGKMNDAGGEPKQGPSDPAKDVGNARGDGQRPKNKEPGWDDFPKLNDQLGDKGDKGDAAGEVVAGIAKNSDDPRKRDLAKEMLKSHGRDHKNGKELKKGPNPHGSGGKSPGISDDVKTAVAKREFAARIGQMQLDDWKKRLTPDLLKKAGMTEADWLRYLKTAQAHDAAVRQLNAKLIQDALKKDLRGGNNPNVGIRAIETTGTAGDALDSGRNLAPPELRPALRRLTEQKDP